MQILVEKQRYTNDETMMDKLKKIATETIYTEQNTEFR